MTLFAIFHLRQKVHKCIHTHFDVSKIYKSLKSWSAITLNLNKKTKWVNGVMGQRVLPLLNFQYWSYDYFFTKNRHSWISHANLVIWWWRLIVTFLQDLCLFLHVINIFNINKFFSEKKLEYNTVQLHVYKEYIYACMMNNIYIQKSIFDMKINLNNNYECNKN